MRYSEPQTVLGNVGPWASSPVQTLAGRKGAFDYQTLSGSPTQRTADRDIKAESSNSATQSLLIICSMLGLSLEVAPFISCWPQQLSLRLLNVVLVELAGMRNCYRNEPASCFFLICGFQVSQISISQHFGHEPCPQYLRSQQQPPSVPPAHYQTRCSCLSASCQKCVVMNPPFFGAYHSRHSFLVLFASLVALVSTSHDTVGWVNMICGVCRGGVCRLYRGG